MAFVSALPFLRRPPDGGDLRCRRGIVLRFPVVGVRRGWLVGNVVGVCLRASQGHRVMNIPSGFDWFFISLIGLNSYLVWLLVDLQF
jgi:hypothetical protein